MSTGAWARTGAVLLALSGCDGDIDLPPRIGSSEYIAYHTDVDASVVCIDELLAREDRFIERTASLLGVDPPSQTIDFVWDPMPDSSAPWACKQTDAPACYRFRPGDDDFHLITSQDMTQRHELVHSVQAQTLKGRNLILTEGLAEYLGTLNRAGPVGEAFAVKFKEVLADGPRTASDYDVTRQLVGWIFTRHGAAGFRALLASMPKDAGAEKFAEVFAAQFGQPLDDALVEMGSERIDGIGPLIGCEEGDAAELAWPEDGPLDITIASECGDPGFYGAGFAPGKPGFYAQYTIEVPEAGYYKLTTEGVAGGPPPPSGILLGCFLSPVSGVSASFGESLLYPGKHVLGLGFPQGAEARGEARVRLEYVGPPP